MTELICFLFGIVIGLGCILIFNEVPIMPKRCKGNCNQGRNCTCT